MSGAEYPIPARLNLVLTAITLAGLVTILSMAGTVHSGWALLALAACYGLLMNTGYALVHESEHGILHSNRRINLWCGVILMLFFPAPYHLIRQGHLGHHMRNRSDDEAFDFYFEGESALWRWLQLYGILTGFFWATIALSNFVCAAAPRLLRKEVTPFERTTVALQKTLNPRHEAWIQAEALAVFAVHGVLMVVFAVPLLRYLAVLCGFGCLWSAMQYVHHFGTTRDVLRGARNLKTLAAIDLMWLNHNWHLNHHLNPTVPWIHLPRLAEPHDERRSSLIRAYLRMWRGPRFSPERIENRFSGRIIQ
ncbi:MAG TPA: fatty acid desaturase [Bryobacteraceae bacterium]|nr:fatty acid desaturase [Bryobacteraceae bacterium]